MVIKAHLLMLNVCINRYLVAVVSNQGGISLKSDPKSVKSDQKRLADFKGKVGAVLNQLEFPISVYAATARDQYRKPRAGMWKELLGENDLESADAVDLENSFFVGDAGGREAVAGVALKDHSCVDRCVVVLRLRITVVKDANNVQRLCRQCWHTVSYSGRILLAARSETICTRFRSNHVPPRGGCEVYICK